MELNNINLPCKGCNSEKYFTETIQIETEAKKIFKVVLCRSCQRELANVLDKMLTKKRKIEN